MTPVIRTLIAALALVLIHAAHVHCTDFTVRSNGVPLGPNDYLLTFANNWDIDNSFHLNAGRMQFRCYAVLYYPKIPKTIEIARFNLSMNATAPLAFHVRSRAFPYDWRIQCDYRFLKASLKARKDGLVLVRGPSSKGCLNRNGGCQIQITEGNVIRKSRYGIKYLGMLPIDCIERTVCEPARLGATSFFGTPCPGLCHFSCPNDYDYC